MKKGENQCTTGNEGGGTKLIPTSVRRAVPRGPYTFLVSNCVKTGIIFFLSTRCITFSQRATKLLV